MAKHTHKAIMTIAPSGARKEIARGAEFTPANPQEARDLERGGLAAPLEAGSPAAPAKAPAAPVDRTPSPLGAE